MSPRGRIVSFGCAAAMALAGILAAVLVEGGTGQLLALVLIGLGLVLATSLVFLEVGLSEDRELARERRKQRRRTLRPSRGEPMRLDRMRGHRRRLR